MHIYRYIYIYTYAQAYRGGWWFYWDYSEKPYPYSMVCVERYRHGLLVVIFLWIWAMGGARILASGNWTYLRNIKEHWLIYKLNMLLTAMLEMIRVSYWILWYPARTLPHEIGRWCSIYLPCWYHIWNPIQFLSSPVKSHWNSMMSSHPTNSHEISTPLKIQENHENWIGLL